MVPLNNVIVQSLSLSFNIAASLEEGTPQEHVHFHNVKGWNELAVNSLYWNEGSLAFHFKQVFAPYFNRDTQQMPCRMRLKPTYSGHYTLNISAIDNNVLFHKIINNPRSQIRTKTVNFPSEGAPPCKNKGGSICS